MMPRHGGAEGDSTMRRATRILAALIGLASADAALAAPADPEHGGVLARRWCAACHIVADDQAQGTDNVPTFAAIAAKPGFDAGRIATFLRDPHPKMPDMQLSGAEAADLAAYIASLRK
jgi:mono/diheme cytochrome c family protein